MDSERARGSRYRLVLRGELGEPFGFLFQGMQMDQVAGTTVLTGRVIDQAHLHGLIQRTQELGLELISIHPARARSQMRPNVRLADRAEAVARRNGKIFRMALPGIAAFGLPGGSGEDGTDSTTALAMGNHARWAFGGTFGPRRCGYVREIVKRQREHSARRMEMLWIITCGIIYLILVFTLGVMSIRKGHWVMFIIGFFLPFFWLIGALMPSRRLAY